MFREPGRRFRGRRWQHDDWSGGTGYSIGCRRREGGGVVLVRAPAGSGKTVLLRSWVEVAGLEDQVGWVSVERTERDAQRFWLAVIDALAGAVDVVQRVAPAPTFHGRALVEQLLADLELLQDPAVLVLHDLHELESGDALEWLELFLAHGRAEAVDRARQLGLLAPSHRRR